MSGKEKGLSKRGWEERFTARGKRLREAVQLYKSLGYEVKLEVVDADKKKSQLCRSCLTSSGNSREGVYKTIYVRRKVE